MGMKKDFIFLGKILYCGSKMKKAMGWINHSTSIFPGVHSCISIPEPSPNYLNMDLDGPKEVPGKAGMENQAHCV